MTSYSSILRKNKPLDALGRGLKKDDGFQNGVLIEKIYCDRNKGLKSSNIRLVDSSSAANTKIGPDNNITSELSEKTKTNQENVETRNPKILQTLETTHTFVTNSGGSYYLQTNKATQSIIDDLEEFPALGTNRPAKRAGDATQISQLSPYAKPFVFTGAFEGNTIYNAYRYYDYNDGPDDYDAYMYDVDIYNGDPNGNIDETWNETEQVETNSPDVEYEIVENNDDPNHESISRSRKKYLSDLSVDAKPFELKKIVTNKHISEQQNFKDSSVDVKPLELKSNSTKRDNAEQHSSNNTAVPSLRPSYRSISVESSPFMPRNSFSQNTRSDNQLLDDNLKKNEEKNVSNEDKFKRISFRSQFEEQSRNFRIDREAVFQTIEDVKNVGPVYKSPSARLNLSKDIPTESKSESGRINLSVDAKPFNIKKISQTNAVSSEDVEKNIQDEDPYNKKKFPLMPLPSNSSKSTVSQNIKLRPDAQPFSITKSKVGKQIDELENQNPNSSIHNRNNSPTRSTNSNINGASPTRTFKHSFAQNDYKQVHSSSTAKTTNRANDNIVSWRRGALSKLVLNSSDDPSNKDNSGTKKFNQASPTNRRSFIPTESHSTRSNKLSHEAQLIKHARENETVENKDYKNAKAEANYDNSSYLPYVQPWSNGTESPISRSNSNGSEGQMSNVSSSYNGEDSKAEISRHEKTSLFTAKDSDTKIGVQYKDHFKRDIISNVDPKPSNTYMYTERLQNPDELSNCYSPNCSPEPKVGMSFHPLSHGVSDPPTNGQTPEDLQTGFIQQWNNYNQYRHDQSAAIFPQCNGPGYIHERIYQTQAPQASFQSPLNMRNFEQANSEMNMSPIHHQAINNQVNSFPLHSAENRSANINTNFHPQAPGYDLSFWNMRQSYNSSHSDPMLAYRQPLNPTAAPNSLINPPFPIPSRYIGPQILPHNSMQTTHHLPNRFPNEYINENQVPIQQRMPQGHLPIAHNISNRFPNANLPPAPQFMARNSIPVSHNLPKPFSNEYKSESQSPISQMVTQNAIHMPYNLPNRFPNEHRNENRSPVQNTSIIEANYNNNGANRVPPPWPTNFARDFNQFMEMYAQKLTSQMLPVIQDNHLITSVTRKSPSDETSNNRETIPSDYLENKLSTHSVPLRPQSFKDVEVLKETSKSTENNFIKLAKPDENPLRSKVNVLQQENQLLLIPPPIPPRRNINSNHSNKQCMPTTANSSYSNNPFKNSSLSNTFEEKAIIQNEKTAKLLHSCRENKVILNDSGNNVWSLQDPSPSNVSHNVNTVSKNPFLSDFTSESTREITEKRDCMDLNPFRQALNESASDKPRGRNPFLDIEVENIDTNEAILTSQPIIDLPKDPLWYYRDPQNDVQGPFTSIEMAEWFHSGYFKDEVQIRRNCDKRYIGIGEFLKLTGGSSPFLESRSVAPLGLEPTISRNPTNPFSDAWQSMLSQKPCKLYDS